MSYEPIKYFFKLRIITKLICIFCFKKKMGCFEKIFVCVFKTCCCNLNYCISLKQHTSAFREILFCLNYNITYLDYCFFKLSWYTCFFFAWLIHIQSTERKVRLSFGNRKHFNIGRSSRKDSKKDGEKSK